MPIVISKFNDTYTDYGVDIDGDGRHDYLAIDVGINVTLPGNYTLRGNLYDLEGNLMLTTSSSLYLPEGVQTVQLNFDGQTIYESGTDGPYELRYLVLYDNAYGFIGSRDRPYTTRAYNFTQFEIGPVSLNWNLANPLEVLLNQTFNISLTVNNPSNHILDDLQAVLTLPSEFDTTEPLNVNVGELKPDQTKEIDWTLKAINPGYGEITVNVTSPDILNISVARGIIVTHFPLSVETDKKTYLTGDNVIITTTTTNENPEVSYIDLLVNLTLEGPGVKEPYSMPIDFISSLETRNFALTWDSTGKPFGNYVVTAKILEDTITLNETTTSFTLTTVDNIPPTTLLTIGEPKHLDLMGNVYVSSATPFTLTAEDNPGGTGVASTSYRVHNSSYDTGWLEYSAPFYFTGLSDGEYSIDYYSTDNIGNTEPTNTATVILDNTPPTTTLTIGEPKYVTEITYVTPDTPFNLTATDNPGGTGVALTAYKIRNVTYNSGWLTYIEPFLLTGLVDGVYSIDYNSTDNANNVEPTNTINVTLFSWNYVFTDSYGRDTTLKINTEHKFFQFITPDKDYGIREATYMRVRRRTIRIYHRDDELRLITLAIDTKLDFCVAIAWDLDTRTRYFLIDKPGIE